MWKAEVQLTMKEITFYKCSIYGLRIQEKTQLEDVFMLRKA